MIDKLLPSSLFTREQVREMDFTAINHHGIDGYSLMSRAAQFSFEALIQHFPGTRKLITLCGSGNNAGDGYIVAALAKEAGLISEIYYLSEPEKLKGDALSAYSFAKEKNVDIQSFTSAHKQSIDPDTVIVDALLGTGLNSEVKGLYRDAIAWANESPLPIMAIDIPSGICANTGTVLGLAIDAQATACFIGLKIGLFTGSGQTHTGKLYFDDLNVPQSVINKQTPCANLSSIEELRSRLPKRPQHAHKGSFGHTLIIGGAEGYGGASLLAAESALRSGSGLTSLITHDSHCAASLTRIPEVMVNSSSNLAQSLKLIHETSVIVIGPGLGQGAWAQRMLSEVIELDKPVVLDADALNLISANTDWAHKLKTHGTKRIITPHPGEAARLLNTNTQTIQSDRLNAVKALSEKFGCHVLLKGSGSLIASPAEKIMLCPYGNPGMASGGMGDVLSGLIGGLLAQKLPENLALNMAVTMHSRAADIKADKEGERGLCANDLIYTIRQLLNT